MLNWHTGDYVLDTLHPNTQVCPMLNTVTATAYSQPDFLAYNTTLAIKELNSQLDAIFGKYNWEWKDCLDCMMSAVCSGRPIPTGTSGATMTEDIFNAAVKHIEYYTTYRASWNNSQWAKMAMGTLSYDIRTRLEVAISDPTVAYKFILWSAHDVTIIPMLAILFGDKWDRLWPPYASLGNSLTDV